MLDGRASSTYILAVPRAIELKTEDRERWAQSAAARAADRARWRDSGLSFWRLAWIVAFGILLAEAVSRFVAFVIAWIGTAAAG